MLLEGHGDHLIVSATDGLSHILVRIPDVDAGRGRVPVSHAELAQLLTAIMKGDRKRELDGLPVTVNATDPDRPVIDLDGYSVPIMALPMDCVGPVPRCRTRHHRGRVTVAGSDRFRLSVAHVPAVTVATETTAEGAVLPSRLAWSAGCRGAAVSDARWFESHAGLFPVRSAHEVDIVFSSVPRRLPSASPCR